MEKIFNEFLSSRNEDFQECLTWSELSLPEKRLFVETSLCDVDYLCFFVRGSQFSENLLISSFLSSLHGRFYERARRTILRGRGEAYLFARIGNFQLAVITNTEQQGENEEAHPFIIESREQNDCHDNILPIAEEALSKCSKFPLSFMDFSQEIVKNFETFPIAIFCFGQKQNLDHFISQLPVEDFNLTFDIALACEYSSDHHSPYVKRDEKCLKMEFFSQFLSPNVGNFLSRKKNSIDNNFRVCFYNTVHHKLSNLESSIKFKKAKIESAAESNLNNQKLATFIAKGIQDIISSVDENCAAIFRRNRLRQEVYFNVDVANSIAFADLINLKVVEMKERMMKSTIMTVSEDEVVEAVSVINKSFCLLLQFLIAEEDVFSKYFIILELFRKYLGFVFGSIKFSLAECQEFTGFSLCRDFFDKTYSLKEQFFTLQTLNRCLFFFGKGKKMEFAKASLVILFFIEMAQKFKKSLNETPELKPLVSRSTVAAFSSILSPSCPQQSALATTILIDDFIRHLLSKWKKSYIATIFINYLNDLKELNGECLKAIILAANFDDIYYEYQKQYYCFSASSSQFEYRDFKRFCNSLTFNCFQNILQSHPSKLTPEEKEATLFLNSMKNIAEARFNKLKVLKSYNSFNNQIICRCLFATVNSGLLNSNNDAIIFCNYEVISSQSLLINFFYLILFYMNDETLTKPEWNLRDAISKSLPGYLKFGSLVLATGMFESRYGSFSDTYLLTAKRIDIGSFLHETLWLEMKNNALSKILLTSRKPTTALRISDISKLKNMLLVGQRLIVEENAKLTNNTALDNGSQDAHTEEDTAFIKRFKESSSEQEDLPAVSEELFNDNRSMPNSKIQGPDESLRCEDSFKDNQEILKSNQNSAITTDKTQSNDEEWNFFLSNNRILSRYQDLLNDFGLNSTQARKYTAGELTEALMEAIQLKQVTAEILASNIKKYFK